MKKAAFIIWFLVALSAYTNANAQVAVPEEKEQASNDSTDLEKRLQNLEDQINVLQQELDTQKHKNKDKKHDFVPKITGFMQGQYDLEIGNNGPISNTFRIRRARLTVKGDIGKFSYKLQGEFCNSPSLIDAYIKYKFLPEIAIQAGQFKTPFTLESQISAIDLEMIDYSDEIFGLAGYRDVSTDSENGIGEKLKVGRDIGLMLSGNLFPTEGCNDRTWFFILKYNLGVFNGNGINCLDKGHRKDFVGRIDIHPMLRTLTLSGSFLYGSLYGNDTTNLDRIRWSAGIQYDDEHFVFRSEYIGGNNGRIAENSDTAFLTENFRSNGYYAVFGYWFTFKKLNWTNEQRLMPAIRFDHFAKDMDDRQSPTNKYTIGISYWPIKYVNLKVNYSLVQKKEYDANNNLGNVFTHNLAAILNLRY